MDVEKPQAVITLPEGETSGTANAIRAPLEAGRGRAAVIDVRRIRAVIFDTDGVVTDTARIHAAAWKTVFDGFMRRWYAGAGEEFHPFDVRRDYLRFVDGKPRMDGVRGFLASRGIALPEKSPADEPKWITVAGLAARKDAYFLEQLRRYGVAAFPSSVALLRQLRRRGARTAAVSASRHCAEVLTAAGVADMFDLRVDGVDADELGLPGKPAPALFLEAARRLETAPRGACVIEDSLAGVSAGSAGGFGLVLGVNRGGEEQDRAMRNHGANTVVRDLGEVRVTGRRP